MKYIDADKLIDEINKRLMGVNLEELHNMGAHRVWAYNDVKSIIDEMKQEEPTHPGIEEGKQEAAVSDSLDKEELWRKGSEHPNNKHPYPVINPDTLEMAFAYYDLGWRFDRNYNPGINMLWLDIEKILPFTKK